MNTRKFQLTHEIPILLMRNDIYMCNIKIKDRIHAKIHKR